MAGALANGLALALVAPALMVMFAAGPARAHNDWGLPLVGGLVGGFGLSYMMNKQKEEQRPAPASYAPPPAPAAAPAPSAASTAATIEHQLNVLDDLAAKGYITQQEYQSRRQALLNQL